MTTTALARTPTSVRRIVRLARQGLGADAALLAAVGEEQTLLVLDGDVDGFGVPAGSRFPMAITLCEAMLQRRIPRIVGDTRAHPVARHIPMVAAADVGSYGGTPVPARDALPVATLCVLGHAADPALRGTDARFLSALAATLDPDDLHGFGDPERVESPPDPLDDLDAHTRARLRLAVEVGARLGFGAEALSALAERAADQDGHAADGAGREGSPLGEAIPSVAGAYQSLMVRRPGCPPLTASGARRVLRRGAGSTFSAVAVAALFAVVAGDAGPAGLA